MFKIATLNKISDEGLSYLKTSDYEITEKGIIFAEIFLNNQKSI